MRIKNKKGFEMSFGVMFAIIAGAIILFISIYAATRFIIPTGQYFEYSEAAKQISNSLNPVVNGITSALSTSINFKKETRIYIGCYETSSKSPYFGKQTISFSEESGLVKKWSKPGAEISRYNKYIFSENISQGKTLFIFSKPFYTGYRVDDLVFLSMDNYCFVSAPEIVKEEIISLSIQNINITDKVDDCKKSSTKVCFGFSTGECNISVVGDCDTDYCKNEYDKGYVKKEGKQLNYYGSLLYAAIFSSPEIYDCNIKRLGKKIAELGKVYKDKIDLIEPKECNSVIGNDLDLIISSAEKINSSAQLLGLFEEAKSMNEKNCDAECKVYPESDC